MASFRRSLFSAAVFFTFFTRTVLSENSTPQLEEKPLFLDYLDPDYNPPPPLPQTPSDSPAISPSPEMDSSDSPSPSPSQYPGSPSPSSNPPSSGSESPSPSSNAPSPEPHSPSPSSNPPSEYNTPLNSPSPEPNPPPSPSPSPSPQPEDIIAALENPPANTKMGGGEKAGMAFGFVGAACLITGGAYAYKKRQENIRQSQFGYRGGIEML